MSLYDRALYVLYQSSLESLTYLTYLLTRHAHDLSPHLLLRLMAQIVGSEVTNEELLPLRRCPGRQMHSIRHISDMALLGEEALPHGSKHTLRHIAMELAHTIGFL